MKKVLAIILSAALCAMLLSACGSNDSGDETTSSSSETTVASSETGEDTSSQASEETTTSSASEDIDFSEEVTLTYAISGAAGVGTAVAIQNAIDMISEGSGGAITIELVTDGALGDEASCVQQVMEGSLDMCGASIGVVSNWSDYLAVFQMPFLINNYELEADVLLSDEWAALVDAANKDLSTATIISASEFGIRGVATIEAPVTTIADMAGLKVRTGGNPVINQAMELLGASPTTISFSELYSSLQNHVVDAEEINITSIAMQTHYEVVNYFTDIGMYPWLSLGLINNDVAASLPEGYYDFICECLAEADAEYMQSGVYEWVESATETCTAAGLEICELTDKDEWIALMDPIYEEWSAKDTIIADFISGVQAMQ